jgi:Leucine-rich repeat (LRR) protein
MIEACLAGVAQLNCLTCLKLGFHSNAADGSFQDSRSSSDDGQIWQRALASQLQLRQLELSVTNIDLPALDMSHLKQLTRLRLGILTEGTVLPPQLQHLQLDSCSRRDVQSLAALKQLQRLEVGHCGDFSILTALKSLQHFSCEVWEHDPELLLRMRWLLVPDVSLSYFNVPSAAAATAAVWPQLQQLRQLILMVYDFLPSRQQLTGILAAVAACSSLTKLSLDGSYSIIPGIIQGDVAVIDPQELELADAAAGSIAVCSSLTGLLQLQDLTLTNADSVPGGALALTALTGLTRLVLAGAGAGVDELAATALACNLRQLQHLDLSGCKLGSMGCLAAIGQLTRLTELQLKGSGSVTQRGFMQLTKLQKLRRLGVDRSEAVTDAVLREFWAAVPLAL